MADNNAAPDFLEMFQKMINPMAFPMQQIMMAGLNPEELDKKIGELTTVKHWLNTNVSMLELTIKTLEYQRALLTPSAKAGAKSRATGSSPSKTTGTASKATTSTPKVGASGNKSAPNSAPSSGASPAVENPMLNPALWPWSFMGLDKSVEEVMKNIPGKKPEPKKT